MGLDWGSAIQLVAGIGVVLVSIGLLAAGISRRPTRTFALVLLLWGLLHVSAAFSLYPANPETGAFWADVHAYPVIALPFAIAYFASVFPRPAKWLPEGILGPFAFALPASVVLGVYAVDHSLFWDTNAYSSGTESYGDPAVPKGPLVVFVRLIEVLSGLVAIRFATSHSRLRSGLARRSALFVAIGFFVPAACTCALVDFLYRLQQGLLLRGTPGGGFTPVVGFVYDSMLVVQLAIILALLVIVTRSALRTRARAERRALITYVAFLIATATSAVAVMTVLRGPDQLQGAYAAWGFWSLVGAVLVAYGVVRRHLFDVDLQIKWTLRASTVASAFVVVFFATSELTQEFVGTSAGPLLGIGAAALLLFALSPLQRVAERLADRAMPSISDNKTYRTFRALEIYKAAVEELAEGGFTRKELRALEVLRAKLGIETGVARRIEADFGTRAASW